MVSLDARLAALTGLDAGELLFFTVKLLDLPAEAGRFLHGLGGELRGVVGDHIIRTLGGKRQAEQFQLMPLGEAPQVAVLARKLILGAPGDLYVERCEALLSNGWDAETWDWINRMDTK